ncbi:MAG: TIGR03960 family B12-binding radical SAM protein [Defluviitaleaceae bacterium]|nr:TIGR03960 family B12-binding radical SAM protein [Defluviitaleaceae bacterium]
MRALSDSELLTLTKPGRYTGGDVNAVSKEITPGLTRFAFCFPDVYEIGMSHLGLQMLYFFLNRRDDVFCERVFMPWFDMVDKLQDSDKPLFAIESGNPLGEFDFLGFTLQYEMSYTNILAMLELGKIPLLASQRGDSHPIICAGGPCATNPEPLADFVDFFYIGDGEASLDEILNKYDKAMGRRTFLESIARVDGVYVPSLYEATYGDDGRISSFAPTSPAAPAMVKRAMLPKLGFFPDKFLTPLTEAVQDRAVLEIARGCVHGCRFCQAGFIYRPMRERTVPDLLAHAANILDATGHDEISLLSLSACDHGHFDELLDGLLDIVKSRRVNISLPSTRLDAKYLSALAKTQNLRKSSLTVAPEAGSQRMRDIINKNLTEQQILEGCYNAFLAGYDKIKLYFMSGLPGETIEDSLSVLELCDKVVETYYRLSYEERKRPVSVSVSTSCFVPKAFTPFQWAAQAAPEEFIATQQEVKGKLRNKRITYRYHDAKTAQIEGVLARGDRRLGKAILAAYQAGAIYDGWSEHFDHARWLAAFEQAAIDPGFYTTRQREADEILPWDFIDMGISKAFLLSEWQKSATSQLTTNCYQGCANCGLACNKAGLSPCTGPKNCSSPVDRKGGAK